MGKCQIKLKLVRNEYRTISVIGKDEILKGKQIKEIINER